MTLVVSMELIATNSCKLCGVLQERALRGARVSVHSRVAFGDPQQLMRLPQGDPLATAHNKPLYLPRTQNSADGMQGRPGHFGDILPTDREVDFDPDFDLSASLLG